MIPDGRVADSGEIIVIDPPRRLVLTWRNEFRPELHEEGYSRLTYLIEPQDDMVKLTVSHDIDKSESRFIEAVSTGWPAILSSLKSLLETGESLEATRRWAVLEVGRPRFEGRIIHTRRPRERGEP